MPVEDTANAPKGVRVAALVHMHLGFEPRSGHGFGGREVRLIGAWDLPLSRLGWRAYRFAEGRRRAPRARTAAGDAG